MNGWIKNEWTNKAWMDEWRMNGRIKNEWINKEWMDE